MAWARTWGSPGGRLAAAWRLGHQADGAVLGPGRRWPKMILPLYKLAEAFPAMRPTAERLGLVTIEQFVKAMVGAAENPPASGRQRIVDVPAIKSARL